MNPKIKRIMNLATVLWYLFVMPGVAAFSSNVPSTYVFVILCFVPPIAYILFHLYSKRKNLLFMRTILYILFFFFFLALSSYGFEFIDKKYGYSGIGMISLIFIYGTPIVLIKFHNKYMEKLNTYRLINLCKKYVKTKMSIEEFRKGFNKRYRSGYKILYFSNLFEKISSKIELLVDNKKDYEKLLQHAGLSLDLDLKKENIIIKQKQAQKQYANRVIKFEGNIHELIEWGQVVEFNYLDEPIVTLTKDELVQAFSRYKSGNLDIDDLVLWVEKFDYDSWSFNYDLDMDAYNLISYISQPKINYSFEHKNLDHLLK